MHKIYLDTNFVIKCIEWKIDFIGELERICDFKYEIILLDNVMDELSAIAAEGGKKKEIVNVGLLVLSKNGAKNVPSGEKGLVDDILVKLATKNDIVATQDQDLKRRLKEKNVSVIIIREKGYLELVGRASI